MLQVIHKVETASIFMNDSQRIFAWQRARCDSAFLSLKKSHMLLVVPSMSVWIDKNGSLFQQTTR